MLPGIDVPPICQVKDCTHPSQIVEKRGDNKTYMKTCRRHDYTELPSEKDRNKGNKQYSSKKVAP